MISPTYSPDRIVYGAAVLRYLGRRAWCRAFGCKRDPTRKACHRCDLYDEERLRLGLEDPTIEVTMRFDPSRAVRAMADMAASMRRVETIVKRGDLDSLPLHGEDRLG